MWSRVDSCAVLVHSAPPVSASGATLSCLASLTAVAGLHALLVHASHDAFWLVLVVHSVAV